MKTEKFPHLARFMQHSCKQLHVTRDEIVRATGMCCDKATAVWNGKDVKLSYYLDVCKELYRRSQDPRYKFPPDKFLSTLLESLKEELTKCHPEEPPCHPEEQSDEGSR